jgi:nucleoside-diphosphate kinase
MTKREAEGFYAVHDGKKFFESLTAFMCSGPCVPMVLEREDAISRLREIMGATDPAKATDGTIRKRFASSVERNVIHGSDSPESAADEIPYFFPKIETRR